jgi:WD40 repeat protein/serine/threonine protein kinase
VTADPKRVEAIFTAALTKASLEERACYLDEACAGDAELRRRIEALLKAYDDAGSFLQSPAASEGGISNSTTGPRREPSDRASPEGPGTRIGPYKLLQQLGEGGMGIVYMAEQEQPVRRRVALKIIKPGMDSAQVIARFEAERQALALMDHLNIARVLDAGATANGRPYFVMELVHGVPITRYCDENRLTPRERLELFIPVCQAIQHAHQKGIIHRDIKPSNVMVCLYDGKPVPKVIDFGVAKAIEQRLTERTLFTQYGTIVGTFEYMAPEQAELSQLGVDTRSDVYALGVLLYELLTGTTPLERNRLQTAAFNEILRLIKEEEPPRPSRRLSSSGAALATISQQRRTEPAKLTKLVRGEIDWIVMRCLEKDRIRRYETASGLARDLQHYLADEPVEACPPSAGYRLRKFARKYRMPVIVGAAFALLLVAGIILSVWQAVRATDAEREATQKRADAEVAQEWARAAEQEIRQQWYAATCNAMQPAWESGQVGRVRALLAETETYPDRGFEWYYWQRLCHLELRTLIGHRVRITAVSWSPDGKRLATASGDGTAKVWDADSGQELLTLHGHMGGVLSVCWSPEGKRLATASAEGIAKVWDGVTGRELLSLKRQSSGLCSVCWSPDGKFLATAGDLEGANVWEVSTGQELLTLGRPDSVIVEDRIRSVSWSPDGKLFATRTYGGTAKVWDVWGSKELLTLEKVVTFSWSPDGQRLATGNGDRTENVWDAASGRKLLTLPRHPVRVNAITWSPDGQRLAMAKAATVQVWDAASGRELLSFGHTSPVSSVCWSPDGNMLATGSEDGAARIWRATGSAEPLTLPGCENQLRCVSWSSDGKRLAAGSPDGKVRVWEVATGRELLTLGQTGAGGPAAWSPDGKWMAIAYGPAIKVWKTAGGGEPRTLEGHTENVVSLSWSSDGKRLATGSDDGTAMVWDAGSGQRLLTYKGLANRVDRVCWSPDGQRLATGTYDGLVKVCEAANGRELLSLRGQASRLATVCWSPDSQSLATGSWDGTVSVWDATTGQERVTFQGHIQFLHSVSWSPDGNRLATGSNDGLAKVWDAARGRELLTLKGHAGGIVSVSWSPDGKRLATESLDGTVKVWEAAGAESVYEWARQDRAREERLARSALGSPHAEGFIRDWLLLLPIPFGSGESGGQALDCQLPGEPKLKPKPGQRIPVGDTELVWETYHSPGAVLDFNAVMGEMTEGHVAYAACYVKSDRPRNNLWLQVGSDDQGMVSINGREVYQYRINRSLDTLETIGPVMLEQGTNALLFKVANEGGGWEGCLRFVDESGNPVQDLQVSLAPQ